MHRDSGSRAQPRHAGGIPRDEPRAASTGETRPRGNLHYRTDTLSHHRHLLEEIDFFWPCLVAPRGDKPSLFGQGPEGRQVAIGVHADFRWKNYYSVSDKVSGALTRSQGWRGIDNQRLAGLGGVLSAHVAYKQNVDFLRALAEQLGAVVAPQRDGWMRSALGWAWSASQSLLLPLMFAHGMPFLCCAGRFQRRGRRDFHRADFDCRIWLTLAFHRYWRQSAVRLPAAT